MTQICNSDGFVRRADVLPPVHPYAAQYPLLVEAELAALADDIREHGQHDPIVMQAGVLIDGRNRWIACARAGVEPKIRGYDPVQDGAVEDFIDSVNLQRRHLTAEQRAMAGARILERLVAAGRARRAANLRRGAAVPEGDKLTPSGKSIEVAARMSGSSPGSIKAAHKVVRKGTPELVSAVTAGIIAVSTAAVLAERPPDEQRLAVAGGRTAARALARALSGEGRLRGPACDQAGAGGTADSDSASASAPPDEPLTLTLFEPAAMRESSRPRGKKPLRRVLASVLVLSDDEQRALCRDVLSRLDAEDTTWMRLAPAQEDRLNELP